MVGGPEQGGGVGGAEGAAGGPDALRVLDQHAVRRWAVVIRSAFASRRAEIDALNVFPVPDGDTGTNLYLTFDGAVDRIRALDEATGAGELLTAFAQGLLWTARGNSGVILSQLVRGFAEGCAGAAIIDVPVLVRALARADERAWQGVTDPKEGTILSVSRAAAEAAAAHADEDLAAVSAAVRDAARTALERTPLQLPVLARAGVVDAGGAGFVIILESLERVCAGDDAKVLLGLGTPERRSRFWTGAPGVGGVAGIAGGAAADGRPVSAGPLDPEGRAAQERGAAEDRGEEELGATSGWAGAVPESDMPEFEVMFLLADTKDDRVATLRARLVELGDSVLVVGGDGLWNIHAHVDDAGAAVEAGITAGRPHRIRITTLLSAEAEAQRHDLGAVRLRAGGSGIVACSAGEGIADVFRAAGAVVIASGPKHRASTGQLIEAIREQHRTGVSGVIVLPNDADTELAAAAAVRAVEDEEIESHLVRARTAVQGVAALAVFEPAQPPATNVLAMQAAASATRHGAVTVSNREALTSGGHCVPGDILGIVDSDIVIVGSSQEAVGIEVVRRLLSSGGELLTVVSGAEVPDGLVAAISRAAREDSIGLEVTHIAGGQPVYTVLLGVE